MSKGWAVIGLLAAAAALTGQAPPSDFTVDREKREIFIPCKVAPRKLPTLPEIYPIEVIATYPAPKGQKAHETVVLFDARPQEVQKALEGFGLKAGRPARGDEWAATGPELEVLLELPGKGGGAKTRARIESFLVDRRTGKPLPPLTWRFTGSSYKQPDPAKPDRIYGADVGGTLIGLFPVTDELVVQSNLTTRDGELLKIETAKELLPPEGTPAVLVLRPAPTAAAPPAAVAAPSARPAAGTAIQDAIRALSLPPVRAGNVEAPAIPPAAAAPDASGGRRDAAPAGPAPGEAFPGPSAYPPLPRELPAQK
jgi:hypothetical protein